MGQRHQLFIIAKITSRYRTLAAVHRQWLYNKGPVERCLRLIKILGAASNRVPINHEIQAARQKDEAFWTTEAMHPFPFIGTCLLVGSSFEAEIGYQHRVHSLPFNVTLDEIDNNDGITVIDISDLAEIKYCFMSLDDQKPKSASAYVARYQRKPSDDTDEEDDVEEDHDVKENEVEETEEEEETAVSQWREYVAEAAREGILDLSLPEYQLENYELVRKKNLWNWLDIRLGLTPRMEKYSHLPAQEQPGSHQSLRKQTMDQLFDTVLKGS
ncbi:MAG: hypothetical protein Q9174_005127, partial [Haloplaca sp. 1 TL-2023]